MGREKRGARLPDLETLIKMGFPIPGKEFMEAPLKDGLMVALSILDEQDAVNSFNWYNLPDGLTGQLIERILYYRGQGAIFYAEPLNKFMFLPFANSGTIDAVGRFSNIQPLVFNGSESENGKDEFIHGMIKKPIYEVMLEEEVTPDMLLNGAVILRDYVQQQTQSIIPRCRLVSPILEMEAECLPFMTTALSNSTGIVGMRVDHEDDQAQVAIASQTVHNAALNGQKWVAITSRNEFQDLTPGGMMDPERFLIAMQSIDNFRLQLHGIENGGLFQKKAHELQTESNRKTGTSGSVLQDRTYQRQHFCDIFNSVFEKLNGGVYIWCEPSETAMGGDQNGDGAVLDEIDQTGEMPGDQEVI